MKYLLTFVVDEGAIEDTSPEEMREAMERWNAFDEEATEKGALIACEPLEGSSAATTIRIRENEDRRAGEAGGVRVALGDRGDRPPQKKSLATSLMSVQ
jgi:hypothetical protein